MDPRGASIWTDDQQPGQPQQSYYDILGVAKDADADAIRRAYRRAALRCHPDKAGDDPAAAEQFQRLSKAYEVISDDKKRQVYDKYGPNGVEMMNKMPFLDVSVILAMKNMFFVLTVGCIVLLLFPIFLSMRVDGKINWSWPAVFSPTFAVLGIVLIVAVFSPVSSPDEEEADQRRSRMSRILDKLYAIVYLIFLTLFDILVSLRLEGSISCEWALIFTPWFALEISHLLSGIVAIMKQVREGVFKEIPENLDDPEAQEAVEKRPFTSAEIVQLIGANFNFFFFRVLQTIMLVIKIDKPEVYSWPVTFVPLYLYIIISFLPITIAIFSQLSKLERTDEKRSALIFFCSAFVIGASIFAGFTYLLVRRISGDDGYPPAAVILIPVFFIFAILICCCGCCLPCIMSTALDSAIAEMNAQNGGGSTGGEVVNGVSITNSIPLARRIAPTGANQSNTTLKS